jgi:hypothetical protein
MNRELEKMIAESMSVNMSDSTEGGKSLTITATDEDALKLAGLLKNAGLGGGEPMGQEMGHGDEHGHSEEPCPSCGMSDCGCGDIDEALAENNPDWPTDQEGTEDAMMYSGGLNGPKSTGQTTVPVIASQENRQATYEEDQALRRMMEMAGVSNKQKLDEGIMDKLKSFVLPKLMKMLGPEQSTQIASAVKQATGGDLTPSKENAIKVAQALGFDKMVGAGQSQPVAEGMAGNWQGKIIQLLYTLGLTGSAAALAFGSGGVVVGVAAVAGMLMLMMAEAVYGSEAGQVGAMGQDGNKGFNTGERPPFGMSGYDESKQFNEAGVQQDNLKPWERTMKEDAEEDKLDEAEKCSACDCDPCECDESVTESFEQMLSRMRDIAGIREAKKPDFLDIDKDGDKKEPMKKAVADKEKKVEESIFTLTNQWKAYKG